MPSAISPSLREGAPVPAVFDDHPGQVRRAPLWMQPQDLEWFYRLMSEPRAAPEKRSLVTNRVVVARMLPSLPQRRTPPRA